MKTLTESLTADQVLVLQYLHKHPGKFISEAAIAQRADGQERYWEDPRWSNHALFQLREMNLVETGENGGFRLKPKPGTGARRPVTKACGQKKRFIAPDLGKILLKYGYCLNCLQKRTQNS